MVLLAHAKLVTEAAEKGGVSGYAAHTPFFGNLSEDIFMLTEQLYLKGKQTICAIIFLCSFCNQTDFLYACQ